MLIGRGTTVVRTVGSELCFLRTRTTEHPTRWRGREVHILRSLVPLVHCIVDGHHHSHHFNCRISCTISCCVVLRVRAVLGLHVLRVPAIRLYRCPQLLECVYYQSGNDHHRRLHGDRHLLPLICVSVLME